MANIIISLLIGSVSGVMSGLFGIGAGIIMIPAMVFLLGFNQHLAQGTSLAIMLPPISIFAVLEYYKTGNINIKTSIFIAIAFVLTSLLGAKLALYLNKEILQRIFGFFLLLISIRMIIK
jgi:uncharacterized protein